MNVADSSVVRVRLDEILDISAVGELRDELLASLESGQAVELSAAAVERIDTAALQVLSAFCKDARDRAQQVTWHEPSPALIEAVGLLGLNELLDLEAMAA